jgi:RNA-directed DNA polymerase
MKTGRRKQVRRLAATGRQVLSQEELDPGKRNPCAVEGDLGGEALGGELAPPAREDLKAALGVSGGRAMEPRKRPSWESQRSLRQRMAMSECPNNSSLDAQVSPGSWSSASQQTSSAQESGELGGASPRVVRGRQAREGYKPQAVGARKAPEPHAVEQSGAPIVPEKPANLRVTPEESVEGRGAANGKLAQRNAPRIQDRVGALTFLERVGQRARERKGERFVNLLSHIKVPLLREAYRRLKKRAAAGVDGETWESYGEGLDARLLDLQERVQRGSYHPQPVRRVYVVKPDGRMRPLGIPALEDKIVQQAARMLLEPIYEKSAFLGLSYGCRPGRSPHKALDALFVALGGKTNWVLDADIRAFFDTIDFGWMQKFLEHRIGDRRMVRLLMKWLKAGVMEEGKLHEVEQGTPQGGVISPLLANIYLHYVLDLWVQQWRKQQARGQVYVVRYVDDVVLGLQCESDARAMRTAMAERLATFKLELHPDKTRVLRFGRFARRDSARDGRARPETFDFLGFTHISGEDPRTKTFRLLRRTSRKKRVTKLAALEQEIRRRRHAPVVDQYRWLSSVLRGHYAYYGVPGNFPALALVRHRVRRVWHQALQRRSQRAHWNRQKHDAFDARFPLPKARITHVSPLKRFSWP